MRARDTLRNDRATALKNPKVSGSGTRAMARLEGIVAASGLPQSFCGALVAYDLERQPRGGRTLHRRGPVAIDDLPRKRSQETGRRRSEAHTDDVHIHGLAVGYRVAHTG